MVEPLIVFRGAVHPDLIDYNGHMAVSAYLIAFGAGLESFLVYLGINGNSQKAMNIATKCTACHPRFLKECFEGEPLVIEAQLMGFDRQRIHLFQRMRHGEKHVTLATEESIVSNHRLGTNSAIAERLEDFQSAVLVRLKSILQQHASLPRPEGIGAAIALHQSR